MRQHTYGISALCALLRSITNYMQRNTIFFIVVKALQVSGGFPTHYQELKNCTYNMWYLLSLVAATPSYARSSSN